MCGFMHMCLLTTISYMWDGIVLLMSISNQYWDEIVLNSLWMSYWPCLGTAKKVLLGRVLSFLFCVCPTEDAWMASLPVTVQVHMLSLCASPFMPRVSYLNFAAVTFQLALEKPDSYKKCGGRFFSQFLLLLPWFLHILIYCCKTVYIPAFSVIVVICCRHGLSACTFKISLKPQ